MDPPFFVTVDCIINNATSIDTNVVSNLILALGKQKDTTGKENFYIHTTGLSAFDQNTNWPFGEVKDTDHVYDLERKSADTYIVRKVDTFVVERLKSTGVRGFLIFPPTLRKLFSFRHPIPFYMLIKNETAAELELGINSRHRYQLFSKPL